MRRVLILAFILCVYALVFSIDSIFAQKRSVTVGIIIDGPWAHNIPIQKTRATTHNINVGNKIFLIIPQKVYTF